mgnify:CR=1 FL=1
MLVVASAVAVGRIGAEEAEVHHPGEEGGLLLGGGEALEHGQK